MSRIVKIFKRILPKQDESFQEAAEKITSNFPHFCHYCKGLGTVPDSRPQYSSGALPCPVCGEGQVEPDLKIFRKRRHYGKSYNPLEKETTMTSIVKIEAHCGEDSQVKVIETTKDGRKDTHLEDGEEFDCIVWGGKEVAVREVCKVEEGNAPTRPHYSYELQDDGDFRVIDNTIPGGNTHCGVIGSTDAVAEIVDALNEKAARESNA